MFHQGYDTATTTPTTATNIPKTTANMTTTPTREVWEVYYIVLSQGGPHHTRLGQEAVASVKEQHRQLGLAEPLVVLSAQVRGE